MDVKLLVLEGKNSGQAVKVTGPKFFIGRADDCQLRPRSDLVSRHHCVILVEEGFVAIRDFGSKNGTIVNDEQIKAEQELKSGDRLTIGTLKFEVQLDVGVGGEKKPKVESVEEAAVRTASSSTSETLTGEEDLDLDSWIGLGDGAVEADTQTVDISDILGDSPSSEDEDDDVATGPTKELPKKDDEASKLPPGISAARAAKITAESSRGAAQDALKKLMRGGK